jgi:hypothetical protein
MPIQVVCSQCAARLHAPDQAAGKVLKCPKCGTPIKVAGPAPREVESIAVIDEEVDSAQEPAPRPAAPKGASPSKGRTNTPRVAEMANDNGSQAKPYDDLEILEPGNGRAQSSSWETSSLGQRDRWLVNRPPWSLRDNVYRDYEIRDAETQDIIGIASDNPGLLIQTLGMLFLGPGWLQSLLPGNHEIREEVHGPLLFRVRRAPQLLKWVVTVQILDHQGKLVGRFRNKLMNLLPGSSGMLAGVFGGFSVYCGEDQKVAKLKFQMTPIPHFHIVTADGKALADVYPEGLRDAIEKGKAATFKAGRSLGLDIKVSPEKRNDPSARLLVLAAVIALQTTGIGSRFFQESPKGGVLLKPNR